MNTIDKILLSCAVIVLVFTITMIVIFCIFQTVPDTLIDSFFGLFTGETIICFVIWYAKRRFNLLKDNEDEDDEQIS